MKNKARVRMLPKRNVIKTTKERLCLFCKHFNFNMGEPDYSEVSPGIDASFNCLKDHWSMSNYGPKSEFIEHIESAKKCKDFTLK